jgi:hypothetical protein
MYKEGYGGYLSPRDVETGFPKIRRQQTRTFEAPVKVARTGG